jgi:hypothetical protein
MGDERAAASEAGGTEEVERAIGGLDLTDVKDHAFWHGRRCQTIPRVPFPSLNPRRLRRVPKPAGSDAGSPCGGRIRRLIHGRGESFLRNTKNLEGAQL